MKRSDWLSAYRWSSRRCLCWKGCRSTVTFATFGHWLARTSD